MRVLLLAAGWLAVTAAVSLWAQGSPPAASAEVSIVLTPSLDGAITLGTSAEWRLEVRGPHREAQLGALPQSADFELRTKALDLSAEPGEARTLSAWILRVTPRSVGGLVLEPLAIVADGVTLRSEPTVFEVNLDVDAPKVATLRWVGTKTGAEIKPRSELYEGQLLSLRLDLRVQRSALKASLLQLFRRDLNLPLRVRVHEQSQEMGAGSWRLRPSVSSRQKEGLLSLVLNDERVYTNPNLIGDQPSMGESEMSVGLSFELEVRKAGLLRLPVAWAEIAYATEFQEDFLTGRRALNRRKGFLYAPALEFEVLPLPRAGRLESFGGAVGDFDIEASLSRHWVSWGENLSLRIRVSGPGSLAALSAPVLPDWAEFSKLGSLEGAELGARVFHYDLKPRKSGRLVIPAIPFVYFFPGRGGEEAGYRTVYTAALSIEVDDKAEGGLTSSEDSQAESTNPAAAPTLWKLAPGTQRTFSPGWPPSLVLTVLLLPWLLAGMIACWRWRQEQHRRYPNRVRSRRAHRQFKRAELSQKTSQGAAFAEYLAARTQLPTAAMIRPDLFALLRSEGVDDDLARRSENALRQMIEPQYSRSPKPAEFAGLATLVNDLERSFRSKEGQQ
ncbi:MAG: BatD family protein [Planctomycetota bacterium]